MAGYPLDKDRVELTATGIVTEAQDWEERAEGGRRPSGRQARHADTGMPLWLVTVVYTQVTYGRPASVTAQVLVPSEVQPVFGNYVPVVFDGLYVEVRTNKSSGALIESFRADAIASGATTGARPAARGRVEGEAA